VLTYWFAWRVLPQRSGELKLPVSAPATVVRDPLGVPHIRAATVEDAIFVQGYVTAQDRLWQMDMIRRKASGELAEVAGPAAYPLDEKARRLRLRKIAEQHARQLPPEERALLAAYARGVNHFLKTHLHALPLEFTLMGYDPRPWSVIDTLAIGMEMARTLSHTHEREVRKSLMRKTGDRALVDRLFPARTGLEPSVGSNAWAVSGAHTATGKPLLASDPHLEFSFPSVWYQVHLQAPGLNVTGVSLPGVPLVIIGHNERIAWGMTNLHFDVMDLEAVTRLDPRLLRVEQETIAIKGTRASLVQQSVTPAGPIFSDGQGGNFVLRWSLADPGYRFVFLDLNRARDWQEFRAALSRYPGPAQNFVYADVDGNIGYQAGGRLPIRGAQCDPTIIAAEGDPTCARQGTIPFEDLPSVYNPPSGRIVTANQNPFPADYKYPVAGAFSPHYRAQQIDALLRAPGKLTAAGMLVIQKDVYSPFSHWLAKELARAGANRTGNAALTDAVAVLRQWNGQMEQGQAAPLVTQLAFESLRRELVQRAAPGQPAPVYDEEIAPAVVEKLFRERPAGWFADYDAVLLRALVEAVQTGVSRQGSNVARWDFSREPQSFTLPHPALSQLPGIGQYFQIGPAPMSGSSTTVKQTTPRLGPSMRFVADLADWENSRNNITIGQSGQPFSGHFMDQWEAYYTGQSFPMPFRQPTPAATLQVVPE